VWGQMNAPPTSIWPGLLEPQTLTMQGRCSRPSRVPQYPRKRVFRAPEALPVVNGKNDAGG
jgi:hypothetical protein